MYTLHKLLKSGSGWGGRGARSETFRTHKENEDIVNILAKHQTGCPFFKSIFGEEEEEEEEEGKDKTSECLRFHRRRRFN